MSALACSQRCDEQVSTGLQPEMSTDSYCSQHGTWLLNCRVPSFGKWVYQLLATYTEQQATSETLNTPNAYAVYHDAASSLLVTEITVDNSTR